MKRLMNFSKLSPFRLFTINILYYKLNIKFNSPTNIIEYFRVNCIEGGIILSHKEGGI